MGYINKTTQNFITAKLTDVGRRKISQGKFNISYFQIGDSEINYNEIPNFDSSAAMILEPAFNAQNNSGVPESTKNGIKYPYYLQSEDGITYGIPLQVSSIDNVYATATPLGFFTADTTCGSSTSGMVPFSGNGISYNSKKKVQTIQFDGTNSSITISDNNTCSAANGTISAKTYVSIYMGNTTEASLCNCISSYRPLLTYKVKTLNSSTSITLDRNVPNFDGYFAASSNNRLFFYYSGMSNYDYATPLNYFPNNVLNYESLCIPETGMTKIWNMNIPWSENPAGSNSLNFNYYDFPSANYLGTKEYYGYTSNSGQTDTSSTYYYNSFGEKINVNPEDQKAISIVHYTNNNIVNFYGEKFATEYFNSLNESGLARNFVVSLPWLMWHKNTSSTNCGKGVKFYIDPPGFDSLDLLTPHYIKSSKNYDMNDPGIRYYHLYDTNANSNDGGRPNRVGKVFPDDKIIIFDDEEIVAAMSYASNRNFTLPAPKLTLTPSSDTNGILLDENECLWVTYNLVGPWNTLHCNYYTKIVGQTSGCSIIEQDVVVTFGDNFKCMSQPNTSFDSGYYGTIFNVLVQKVQTGNRPLPNAWKIINFTQQLDDAGYINANNFISSTGLITEKFIITKQKYDSANVYNINTYLTGLPKNSSLTPEEQIQFGEEFYFFGTISADTEATIYEMRYLVNLPAGQFTKSSNPTWTDGNTAYMTEIGLYDDEKNLVVYSKFQSPQIRQAIQQAVVKFDI